MPAGGGRGGGEAFGVPEKPCYDGSPLLSRPRGACLVAFRQLSSPVGGVRGRGSTVLCPCQPALPPFSLFARICCLGSTRTVITRANGRAQKPRSLSGIGSIRTPHWHRRRTRLIEGLLKSNLPRTTELLSPITNCSYGFQRSPPPPSPRPSLSLLAFLAFVAWGGGVGPLLDHIGWDGKIRLERGGAGRKAVVLSSKKAIALSPSVCC
ncbi:hypothetical protein BHE74_00016225 [Ensete ventricosum]|nr:hypothetical protein GW17_00032256 [Ensete ventricosum]RWW75726.1 hypothetical protein BHE74_00016225 [Ensete ventricosum]